MTVTIGATGGADAETTTGTPILIDQFPALAAPGNAKETTAGTIAHRHEKNLAFLMIFSNQNVMSHIKPDSLTISYSYTVRYVTDFFTMEPA